jgi:hypothetical protein
MRNGVRRRIPARAAPARPVKEPGIPAIPHRRQYIPARHDRLLHQLQRQQALDILAKDGAILRAGRRRIVLVRRAIVASSIVGFIVRVGPFNTKMSALSSRPKCLLNIRHASPRRAYTLVNAINIADGTELIAARNATTS